MLTNFCGSELVQEDFIRGFGDTRRDLERLCGIRIVQGVKKKSRTLIAPSISGSHKCAMQNVSTYSERCGN